MTSSDDHGPADHGSAGAPPEVVDFGLLDDLGVTPEPEVVDFSGLGDVSPADSEVAATAGIQSTEDGGGQDGGVLADAADDRPTTTVLPASPVEMAHLDESARVAAPAAEVVDIDSLVARRPARSTRPPARGGERRRSAPEAPSSDDGAEDGGDPDDAAGGAGERARPKRRSSFGDGGSRGFGGRPRAGGAGKKKPRREWGIQLDAEVEEPRPAAPADQAADPAGDGPAPEPRADRQRSAPRGRAGSFGRPRRAEGEPPPVYEDPEQTAKQICLTALTGASRSRKQLADLLASRDIPDDVSAAVLDRFSEVGLVDDAAFAAAWVSSRQSARGLSRRALSHELRAKGVDPEVASVALEAVDPQDEWDTARALVARKVPGMRRLDTATATRRLTGMLARKGYGMGLAAWVVREALEADGKDEDAAAEADDAAPDTAGAEPVVRRGLWSGRPLDEESGTEVGEGLTVDGYARTRSPARRPGGFGRR